MITPNVPVFGYELSDYYVNGIDKTQGTIAYFGNNGDPPAATGSTGVLIVNNALAPAYWNVTWLEPWNCGTNTDPTQGPILLGWPYYEGVSWWEYESQNALVQNYYPNKLKYSLDCYLYVTLSPASTRFAILGNLPNTLTLGSEAPLTTQYGMPLLYVYDKTGNLIDTETATSVDSSGIQATFPFPSTLQESGYSLALVNQTGGGVGFAPAGDNLLSIASSQTIAGNPFGVAVGGQTDTYDYCSWDPDDGKQCSDGSNSYTFPIVSLYSSNQVLIGSQPVQVGQNPMAVVTNSTGSTQVIYSDGNDNAGDYDRDTFTGSTIAVVANSGGNTVSVLDIVNDVVLYTIPVGNQPVALAMSSDGNTAYVANFRDSTVTQVNLNSGTATATVAVGGQPTSVALTSAGILWVGGVGFLTEINTQTMGVVATEPVIGKTIIALGFSNSVNELIATSVDTGGNVYSDEISPSTFQAGNTYTPLASHSVSNLGTYLNQNTNAQVRAFTATLASTNSISTNQVGAPPLVVQDGWAVVTATPTGFTITDITGHVVLVSEQTPSPVTAIAVDPKLNVAYLTMPDSNILLTVPLPGTN
jgi:YVTN family beta-propeller protein